MPRSIARRHRLTTRITLPFVIHNYRWRIGVASGEPQYDELEKRLAEGLVVAVPAITMEGDANGAPHPPAEAYRSKFSGKYEHRTITGGVGHNLPQEARRPLPKLLSTSTVFDRAVGVPADLLRLLHSYELDSRTRGLEAAIQRACSLIE